MIIGIDFDNTIVSYDRLFHRVALERGLIPADHPVDKTAVRDRLRAEGYEPVWTEMQGIVYGPRLSEAQAFEGFIDFVRTARARGITVRIVSHKTRFPYAGEKHDLHAAAWSWLEKNGLFDHGMLERKDVFLETSKAEKLARIGELGCTHFIDDLPEILNASGFPAETVRLLFSPAGTSEPGNAVAVRSWNELSLLLLAAPTAAPFAEPLDLSTLRTYGSPLAGGANNRLFKVQLPDGSTKVLKEYFKNPNDPRDRFGAEYSFYRYARQTAARGSVPMPLQWDPEKRLGLFEHVEGRKLSAAEVDGVRVNQALDFIAQLNTKESQARASLLPRASESLLTHRDAFLAVDRRLERLGQFEAADDLDLELKAFLSEEARGTWLELRDSVAAQFETIGIFSLDTEVSDSVVSPSDFGFHNTLLRPDGSLCFLDFEYAGWDDPAKLLCDYFCQPAIPVPEIHFDEASHRIARDLRLADPEAFVSRCRALLPVFRFKWLLLMLNEFLPAGRQRRAFSLGMNELRARKAQQLNQSRDALQRLLAQRT